ncbi:ubiquitin-conjugating enzyme [Pseudozyma hubeiensis SY62]|uniref:Ubiquitin-conjugating enzyme n=1 Tax=Pseudozyma hubeiensis (strain SY62) TaxID=1305764 RepID=R9NZY0_PSEHS|nr:ubiquitin-conjugating enzyme [Pseudozyma hubeiensis SY62]GAC94396.1 ubiquitin-conjugating enzyme [Pseudozyma hubeiensis SY62]
MATATSHNKKSSAIKRILSEARELSSDTSSLYTASPLDDNIFEWHFTLRGPANTEFADGLYHGRILLPAEYPMRPPDVMLLTPNGRWELNKKICLTFTGFHEEMWQPAWGVRTALLGLQTFMAEREEKAVGVGGLEWGVERRRALARESRGWKCEVCAKTTVEMLPDSVEAEEQVDQKGQVSGDASNEETTASREQPSEAPTAASASITTPAPSRPPSPPVAPSQLHQPLPAPPAPSLPPRTSPLTSTPPINHTSSTQQKLTLIDNCIKALSILVALLVVKRLV